MRIVVTGSGGQLGAAVVYTCSRSHAVVPLTHADLDITDDGAVRSTMERERPDAIVNCAAFNEVDEAEDRPVDALNVNAFGVRALARAAERAGAAFVHFSTDFVFAGAAAEPYTEEDRPGPLSVYATTKLLGEWFALDVPRAFVLRVESLFGQAPGGPPSRGTVAAIARGLLDGTSPRVFEDRTVSPTLVTDAAEATCHLLESAAAPGLYHCVNTGSCTWFEFAKELAAQLHVPPALTPVLMRDVPLRAQRPQFCALSNAKLRAAGFTMPAWQDAVARYAQALTTTPVR